MAIFRWFSRRWRSAPSPYRLGKRVSDSYRLAEPIDDAYDADGDDGDDLWGPTGTTGRRATRAWSRRVSLG
jgi:hypothetical protein